MKKDLLAVTDFNRTEIEQLFRIARKLKEDREARRENAPLKGKTLGMIFKKASTRTRLSFEAGMVQLGGTPLFLNPEGLQMDRGEIVADTGKIFSMYLDGILIRTFSHSDVEDLARETTIPVINGLTDLHHPCQIISDLYTMKERRGEIDGIKVVYVGDGNNVAHSLLEGCALFGVHFVLACPEGYDPDEKILRKAKEVAAQSGGSVTIEREVSKAVEEAHFLYTDVWTSMGQEKEKKAREEAFQGYQIDMPLVKKARSDVRVLHCLPAHRGEEISAEVIDGDYSIVFEQAANRLHIQKAILIVLLGNRGW